MFRAIAGFSLALCAVLALSTPTRADALAFEGTVFVGVHQNGGVNVTGKGRQTLNNVTIGLDFTVIADELLISAGGIWDDNGDGLANDHTFLIHDTDSGVELFSMILPAGTGGLLVEGYRYYEFPGTVTMVDGTNFTVSVHYPSGNGDSSGNSGKTSQDLEPTPVFDDGGGHLLNIGGGRWGLGLAFPVNADFGPENRYHGPSFVFQGNPEPGTLALVAGIAVAGLALRRRRRKKQEA